MLGSLSEALMGERRDAMPVPRSRAVSTHRFMRQQILERWAQIVFEDIGLGSAERTLFESEFAAAVGQKHAVAVHSGTLALFLALRACDIRPGDEVITVGNSDISTTAAISHCGAAPVLCDISAADYTIDTSLVEGLITRRTTAILPVDLYGHPANVRALRPLADRCGLKIVEDAALATGSQDFGKPVGAYADVTVFSFAPFKPLGSVGNGAVAATNDDALAERLRLLCGYGHGSHEVGGPAGQQSHVLEGYNMPLDPLQAALLRTKLPHLDDWTRARRSVVAAYAEGLAGANVGLPVFRPESRPTFRSYTILVEEQERVHCELLERGIEVVLHYVPPTYRQPVYAGRQPRGFDRLPVTDDVTRRLLGLPVTPELTPADLDYVVRSVREVVGS